jgi:hypothetical protein
VNDVFDRTGRQVVQHQDVVFELQQPFWQIWEPTNPAPPVISAFTG